MQFTLSQQENSVFAKATANGPNGNAKVPDTTSTLESKAEEK